MATLMHKIIDRPVLASIFFAIVVLLGVYSLINTPIDLVPDPEEKLPSLKISYAWPGASPDMLLRKVLIAAEAEISQIRGVAGIESRSLQNRGIIDVEFTRDTNMDFASVALSERLNRLQTELPRQVNRPYIQPYVPDEFEKLPFFNVGVYGDYTIYTLKRVVEREILPYLKSIQGIESIEVYGGVDPEIKIQTNIDKLKRYGISIADIQ
ncbi:MAG TPA: efflux RND transporter permease subunit, partial [Candidatus Aminicenantes bacterium]|nr:efflux RND transporter permease subunit [Candidatus Aminicenantes bacterium]